MENKLLDDFLSMFTRSRKSLVIGIILQVVILVVILLIIWWPKEKDYLTYDTVDLQEKQRELSNNYINEISAYFMLEDKDKIFALISMDYINYTGKTRDEIVKELDDDGFFSINTVVNGNQLYVDGNTYVYTTELLSGGKGRKLNIIETYPYKYSIAFDDFYKYDEDNRQATNSNIKLKIKNQYRNLKYVEYNVSIENLNNIYTRFDFSSVDSVQAVLQDGKRYSAVNLVSKEKYTDVETNTVINKNFVFNIPAQLQSNIEYLLFNNVIISNSTMNLSIDI